MPRTRFTENDGTIQRARRLRRDGTPAEQRLWSALRGSAIDGFKFRRQQRLGPYVADFVCQSVRLVVEVDGDAHAGDEAMRKDQERQRFMQTEGYRTVRFGNADVLENTEGVVAMIRRALAPSPSHPAAPGGPLPLPQGERSK